MRISKTVGLCLLCFVQSAHAQTTNSSSTTAPPSKAAVPQVPKFLTSPFDSTVSSLPPNFQGHDIEKIYDAIKRLNIKPKSEFETLNDYNQRLKSFSNQLILERLTLSSTFAVVLRKVSKSLSSFSVAYDAEGQIMTISIAPFSGSFIEPQIAESMGEVERMDLKTNFLSRGKYAARSALGVNVQIKRMELHTFGVIVTNVESNTTGLKRDFAIPMAPEQARRLKSDLRVLLICELRQPWIRTDKISVEPTIDSPIDVTETWNYLDISVQEVWIFVLPSGEIIKKFRE